MPTRPALYDAIERFEFDAADASLTFTARLARENGWTHAYADRVLTEYRRFIYLAATSNATMTPSEDVDRAWHQHLTFSRSYWDDFCPNILGRAVHHEPTTGGSANLRRFFAAYDATLVRYVDEFDATPPPDIWPPPAQRFKRVGSKRWVDPHKAWVVSKPGWGALALVLASPFLLVAFPAIMLALVFKGLIWPQPAIDGKRLILSQIADDGAGDSGGGCGGGCGGCGG